jgi:hypothetical protein
MLLVAPSSDRIFFPRIIIDHDPFSRSFFHNRLDSFPFRFPSFYSQPRQFSYSYSNQLSDPVEDLMKIALLSALLQQVFVRNLPSSYQASYREPTYERPFPAYQPVLARSEPARSDRYSRYVELHNEETLNQARRTNRDGVRYFSDILSSHMGQLSEAERAEFKEKLESYDPSLFEEIPVLAVKSFLTASTTHVPSFMQLYISDLTALKSRYRRLPEPDRQSLLRSLTQSEPHISDRAREVWKQARKIASEMHQGDANFRASIEGALRGFNS